MYSQRDSDPLRVDGDIHLHEMRWSFHVRNIVREGLLICFPMGGSRNGCLILLLLLWISVPLLMHCDVSLRQGQCRRWVKALILHAPVAVPDIISFDVSLSNFNKFLLLSDTNTPTKHHTPGTYISSIDGRFWCRYCCNHDNTEYLCLYLWPVTLSSLLFLSIKLSFRPAIKYRLRSNIVRACNSCSITLLICLCFRPVLADY